MFDKTAYWKNRKNDKRGQGELESPAKPKFLVNKETGKWIGKKRSQAERDAGIEIDEFDTGKNMVQSGKGLKMINRKQYRQKFRQKYFANEDDHEGKPYTAKGVKHTRKAPKFELTLDPTLSNKQRHHLRRQRREMILEDKRKEQEREKSDLQA